MIRRRFIAGAICPRCSQLDSIFVYQQDGNEYRACSDCDFEEKASFESVSEKADVKEPIEELATRVNNPEDSTRNIDIQTVKIIEVKK